MSRATNWLKKIFISTGDVSEPIIENTLNKKDVEPAQETPDTFSNESQDEKIVAQTVDTASQSLGNFFDMKDVQDVISDCLVKEMSVYRGGNGYPDITIWIDDPVVAQLSAPPFQEKLSKDLLHSGCRPQSRRTSIAIKAGAPEKGVVAVSLSKRGKLNPGKVFLSFSSAQVSGDKAQLTVCKNKGSLENDPFMLDSSEKTRYRIGRGETSTRREYSFRINDIVIKTNDLSPEIQELNNHVSSAHADMVCRDGRFYLQLLPPGSSAENNSTKIVRDQSPIPLDQMGIDYPLQDGDLIELGGSVLLEFKLVK